MAQSLIDRVRIVMGQVAANQTRFADLIGIGKDKLSKSLSGGRRFTPLELALIAEVGGVTVDWLLTGRGPATARHARGLGLGVETGAGRAAAAALALAKAGDLIDRYSAAFQALEQVGRYAPGPRPGPGNRQPDPVAGQSWRQQGDQLAGQAVKLLAEQGHADPAALSAPDLIAAVESGFAVDVAVESLPSGLDGLVWRTPSASLIVVPATRQWTRQRFTVAHALGHLLAGDARQVVLDEHVSPGHTSDGSEIRANQFAASLLLPEELLRAELLRGTVGEVTDPQAFAGLVVRLKVSPGMLAARLRSLELIDAAAPEWMTRLTSLECHHRGDAFPEYLAQANAAAGLRLPRRLVDELWRAYRAGQVAQGPLAGLLGLEFGGPHPTAIDEADTLSAGAGAGPGAEADAEPAYSL